MSLRLLLSLPPFFSFQWHCSSNISFVASNSGNWENLAFIGNKNKKPSLLDLLWFNKVIPLYQPPPSFYIHFLPCHAHFYLSETRSFGYTNTLMKLIPPGNPELTWLRRKRVTWGNGREWIPAEDTVFRISHFWTASGVVSQAVGSFRRISMFGATIDQVHSPEIPSFALPRRTTWTTQGWSDGNRFSLEESRWKSTRWMNKRRNRRHQCLIGKIFVF